MSNRACSIPHRGTVAPRMLENTVLTHCFHPVFREHYLQSQSTDIVSDPAGHPQLASGYEAFFHRILDRHSTEPVSGAHAVCQRQPAEMQRRAHCHQGEDAGGQ